MEYIKSCGFVAFKRENNENYYLIVKSTNGDVGFPKGHVENGESELETATRELKEETGIDVVPIPDFRHKIEYPLPRVQNTIKQAVYFLGKCVSDCIVCQANEVSKANFLCYEDALRALTFKETRAILECAESFINSM